MLKALLKIYLLLLSTGTRAGTAGGGTGCRMHPIPGFCFGFPSQPIKALHPIGVGLWNSTRIRFSGEDTTASY